MDMGISNMGGNMEGTPISMIRKDVSNDVINDSLQQPTDKINRIKKIVSKINKEDIEEKKQKKKKIPETDTDTEEIIVDKKKTKNKEIVEKEYSFNYIDLLKDAGIIWLIYMVLSINILKNFIARYVKWINPNEEGVVPFSGIAVYGLILTLIFIITKFSLIKFDKY